MIFGDRRRQSQRKQAGEHELLKRVETGRLVGKSSLVIDYRET
jgi:hypothetical protein